jgi:hypothetical protein
MPKTNHLKYLKTYSSKNTTKLNRWAIQSFLNTIYDDGDLEELAHRYIQEKRDIPQDIENFFAGIKNRAPTSIRTMMSILKVFLMENNIELPQKFWKKLSRRVNGKRSRTEDRIPTIEELLEHMSTSRWKTIRNGSKNQKLEI